MSRSRHLLLPGAFIVGVGLAMAGNLAGCGGAAPQRYVTVTAAARAYLAAHPAPAVPGMTAGIVIHGPGEAAWPCHHGRGSFGGPGDCFYWKGTLLTAAGHAVTFTCGRLRPSRGNMDLTRSAACTERKRPDGYGMSAYVPEPGDYIYAPAGLHVDRRHSVQVIRTAFYADDHGVAAQCFTGVPLIPPKAC